MILEVNYMIFFLVIINQKSIESVFLWFFDSLDFKGFLYVFIYIYTHIHLFILLRLFMCFILVPKGTIP